MTGNPFVKPQAPPCVQVRTLDDLHVRSPKVVEPTIRRDEVTGRIALSNKVDWERTRACLHLLLVGEIDWQTMLDFMGVPKHG